MKPILKKVKISLLLMVIVISLLSNFSYANTYSNNSIEIEVSPQRRSYDYGDEVVININVTNKNRYAKLHYKIKEVYSGGGFIPLNLDENEKIIEYFSSNENEVTLKDFFYKEPEDRTIDTHITFNNDATSGISKTDNTDSGISKSNNATSGISKNDNANSRIGKNSNATSGIDFNNDARSGISKNNDYQSPSNSQVADSGIGKNNNASSGINKESDAKSGISMGNGYTSPNNDDKADSGISKKNGYYHRKHSYNIGGHAYELTEAEYDEFTHYRNEKVVGEKLGASPTEKSEQEKLEQVKGQINATLLIIFIIVIIALALIIFIWFIIKSRSKGGYPSLSKFTFFLVITLFISNIGYKTYAADIYQENVQYNKTITTQVSYANFTCTFRVTVEYYFVNTIDPITNLELDIDSDTLPDYLEVLYLTDLNNDDTDSDGLPDGVEVYRTYTDPLRVDTDNNGINDSDEDYDKDKLTNIEEKNHGTDYDNIDTDYDSLSDYDEVNGVKTKDGLKTYQTDPLSDDTDSDGLRDDIEIKLGLDPTKIRTDGITIDSEREIYQEMDKTKLPNEINNMSIPVTFYGSVKGLIDENVEVKLSHNSFYNRIRGVVGEPIIIDTTYSGDGGLKAKFDISKYMSIKDDIQVCRYENGELMPVERTYVNGTNLLSDVYSGEYVLIDIDILMQGVNIYR